VTVIIREERIALNASERLRLTLETTRSGTPVVRVGLICTTQGRPDAATPLFTLAVGEVWRVGEELLRFGTILAREAATHVAGKR